MQQHMLNRLSRHSEQLLVCEQLLALSKEQLSGDEYVPQQIGVPSCMHQLATAYGCVGRCGERDELRRSALQLMVVSIRAAFGQYSADVEDLAALQQLLTRQQQLYGANSVQCARTWTLICVYHKQAGEHEQAVQAATELVRLTTAFNEPQYCDSIVSHQLLGGVHMQWQQHALAVAAHERAVDISRQYPAVDQLPVAWIKVSLARCHFDLGHWAEAKRWYSEALPVLEVAEPHSRIVATLRWSLFMELRKEGEEPARQLELLRGSPAIRTQLGDRKHVERETTMLNELLAAQAGDTQEEHVQPSKDVSS